MYEIIKQNLDLQKHITSTDFPQTPIIAARKENCPFLRGIIQTRKATWTTNRR